MPETQNSALPGENAQHFVQFLMMQQQQTLLALGMHPNAPAGAPPANLALAKVFIDQLEAIRARTQGNLTGEEQSVFRSVLATLQTAYVKKQQEPS